MKISYTPVYFGGLVRGKTELNELGQERSSLVFCPVTFNVVRAYYRFSQVGDGYGWVRCRVEELPA